MALWDVSQCAREKEGDLYFHAYYLDPQFTGRLLDSFAWLSSPLVNKKARVVFDQAQASTEALFSKGSDCLRFSRSGCLGFRTAKASRMHRAVNILNPKLRLVRDKLTEKSKKKKPKVFLSHPLS